MKSYKLSIFADYFQFLLQDEQADGDLSMAWTEQTVGNMLAVKSDVIGIRTVRNMDVPVIVEVDDNPPIDDFDGWDQIAECSIEITSGKIVVMGNSDYFSDAIRIIVPASKYRARIYYGKLNTVSDDGLDGDDCYKVVLWQSNEDKGILFLKKWENAS